MASLAKRRDENVAGDVFVDSTCIDCDTCRWVAPRTFDRENGQSRVHTQPASEDERARALMALVACPTASIGTVEKANLKPVIASFPEPLTEVGDGVHYCGYHAESSFGAASYLIVRTPERGGNVLVDSPRFAKPLARNIEALGGVKTILLTHKDDVADHAQWAEHFGAERILHADDVDARTRDVERVLEGEDARALDDELTLIPVPGHTRGCVCLLYKGRVLFPGDHVAWSVNLEQVYAFRRACWYSWDEQKRSMARLAEVDFEWILPGHGRRCHFSKDDMRREMARCVAWMDTV